MDIWATITMEIIHIAVVLKSMNSWEDQFRNSWWLISKQRLGSHQWASVIRLNIWPDNFWTVYGNYKIDLLVLLVECPSGVGSLGWILGPTTVNLLRLAVTGFFIMHMANIFMTECGCLIYFPVWFFRKFHTKINKLTVHCFENEKLDSETSVNT